MSDLSFLKDLLKANSKNFSGEKKESQQFADFENGFIDGFCSKLPDEYQDFFKKNWSAENFSKIIDDLGNSDQDVVGMIDKIIDKFSEQGDFSFQGLNINAIDLFNDYHRLKAQHQKYQESEDINNF